MTLTSQQLDILNQHAEAGDRVAYYEALDSFGDIYGRLALGVVLNDTVAGSSANRYFLNIADEEGQSISANQFTRISLELMLADNEVRQQNSGTANIDQIQDYHEEVFQQFASVSANAWTPNYYLSTFDNLADRQAAWDSLVAGSVTQSALQMSSRIVEYIDEYLRSLDVPPLNDALSFFDFSRQALIDMGLDAEFVDYVLGYQEYLNDLQASGLGSIPAGPSNQYGPFNVSIPGEGQLIGGNQFNNTLEGTNGDDVIMGFTGADVFKHSAGSDRMYGLGGRDIADYGDASARLTVELGLLQEEAQLWAPVISQGNDVQRVLDPSSSIDYLIGIEALVATSHDDVLRLFGTVETIEEKTSLSDGVDGGEQAMRGDTIDASQITGNGGITVSMNAITGVTSIIQNGGSILARNFENIVATQLDDVITGDDAAWGNIIDGSAGDDVINGMGGDDRLLGGDGNDELLGGAGDDIIEGQVGNDDLSGGTGDDLIFASKYIRFGETEITSTSLVFGDGGDDFLFADAGGNSLVGGSGNDVLVGGLGTDLLEGGDGHDLIMTRGGSDEIRGGKGNDWIYALDPDADATILFDSNSGNDLVQVDEVGQLSGIGAITFEDIATGDVDLVWDFQVLDSYRYDDYDSGDVINEVNRNFLSQELGGNAAIVVKSTGASINIGYLEGSRTFGDEDGSFATTDSLLLDFEILDPGVTVLQFSDFSSGELTSRLVGFRYVDPTTGQIGGPRNDFGLVSIENLIEGPLAPYNTAGSDFLSGFDNPFSTDLSALVEPGSVTDVSSLLSQDTIATLEDDIFGFA